MLSQRLLVLNRIGRFKPLQTQDYILCHTNIETHEHLFFTCSYAQDLWLRVMVTWGFQLKVEGIAQYITSLQQLQRPRSMKYMISTLANAVFYNIWLTRNMLMFKGIIPPTAHTVKAIRDQVTHRVLQTHQHKHRYRKCIEFLNR